MSTKHDPYRRYPFHRRWKQCAGDSECKARPPRFAKLCETHREERERARTRMREATPLVKQRVAARLEELFGPAASE